jgi:Zn-dependent protease
MICPACCVEAPDSALSCPRCRRLTHASELEDLARRAKAAWRAGKFAEERELWARSLALLPEDTVQYRSLRARIDEIDRLTAQAHPPHTGWRKASIGIGPALLLVLGKGKFLLLGLTKLGTLLTMAASLGVYWAIYGWQLALGIVLSIYIHEMGHMTAIRHYGLRSSGPMFIPGLGAFIRLRDVRLPPIPDARIGLAGPWYGLGASVVALAVYFATHVRIWGVIAHFGAVINLLNLIPVWQLDGSRGMHSLTRLERAAVLGMVVALWFLTSIRMLLLVAMGCVYRLFTRDWESEPDPSGLWQFLGLLAALAAVGALSVRAMATGGVR